ncbi:DUSP3 [Mytilus edulis]|uniref:protein-serine/threonine phosphatase n=1 Tax=Mytilus edulis TaxID=6550 RepID=A0A8S3RIY5_MYTED|nr:DUSP3 [Mytilus edulis]
MYRQYSHTLQQLSPFQDCSYKQDTNTFSVSEYLGNKGLSTSHNLSSAVISQVLERLDVAEYLEDVQCDRSDSVYTTNIYWMEKDQWSPLNMEGKKLYGEFLLQLQFSKESTAKPKDMPDLPDIVIENPLLGGTASRSQRDNFSFSASHSQSSGEIASNIEKLQKENITHVLNCAQGTKFNQINTSSGYFKDAGIQYYGIKANDISTFKMAPEFDKAAEFLDKALKDQGNKVYVHCHQGISRSATIVLAFLMLKRGMTLVDALKTVRDNRAVHPNDGFVKQLCILNRQLYEKHE